MTEDVLSQVPCICTWSLWLHGFPAAAGWEGILCCLQKGQLIPGRTDKTAWPASFLAAVCVLRHHWVPCALLTTKAFQASAPLPRQGHAAPRFSTVILKSSIWCQEWICRECGDKCIKYLGLTGKQLELMSRRAQRKLGSQGWKWQMPRTCHLATLKEVKLSVLRLFSFIYGFLLFCGVLRCSKECLRGEQRLKITAWWLAHCHFCWQQPFEKLTEEGFTPGRVQQAWPASHYSTVFPPSLRLSLLFSPKTCLQGSDNTWCNSTGSLPRDPCPDQRILSEHL